MKIHLIYNPISGKKTNTNTIKQIIDYAKSANIDLVTYESKSKYDIYNLTKKITTTNSTVNLMVMGGDGSAHDALNGINNLSKTNLYILPGGSGNDFAHHIGLDDKKSQLDNFKELVKHAKIKKADFFLLNNKVRCLNEVSFGISADVLFCFAKLKHFSPKTRYAIATFRKCLSYKNYKFRISYVANKKEEDITFKSPFMTLGNGQYCGGGLRSAPGAKIDDGLITISYLKKFPRILILPTLLKMKKGIINKSKYHVSIFVKEVNVDLLDTKNGIVTSDGAIFEHQKSVNIKVMPKQLNVAVLKK